MANWIVVNGIKAELRHGSWRSADEGLVARLEVEAGADLRSPAYPDSDGRQLDAAAKRLGARVLERDPPPVSEDGVVY